VTAPPAAGPAPCGTTRRAPRYTRGERLADAAVHGLGIPAALAGCAALAAAAPRPAGARVAVALGLYAAGLLAMLGCSALYSLAGEGRRQAVLRRIDHAAIFGMIAGTYTPVALLGIGGAWGWGLLAAVWTGAAAGAALKLLAPGRLERASVAAYLLLGWIVLVALDPLLAAPSARDLGLLVAGGLLYSLGVVVQRRAPGRRKRRRPALRGSGMRHEAGWPLRAASGRRPRA
jgi:hemolysin III